MSLGKRGVVSEISVKNIRCYFEREITRFGNGAKIDIPKEFLENKTIVIVIGTSKILTRKIKKVDRISVKNFIGYFERNPVNFGTGAKISAPKEYLGKKVIVAIKGGKK